MSTTPRPRLQWAAAAKLSAASNHSSAMPDVSAAGFRGLITALFECSGPSWRQVSSSPAAAARCGAAPASLIDDAAPTREPGGTGHVNTSP